MNKQKSFPCSVRSIAINCSKNYGPCFGFAELAAISEPFNTNACFSSPKGLSYNIPIDKKDYKEINMLTNKKCVEYNVNDLDKCPFYIRELEVWGVTFTQ